MANLSIENLSRVIETGDAQGLLGGGIQAGTRIDRGLPGSVTADPDFQAVTRGGGSPGAVTFGEMLMNSVERVNQYQHDANSAIKELVAGRTKNVHETMLAVERAEISLKLMMQVRNKIVDAYREIMRMQV